MSNPELKPGTMVQHPASGDTGQLLGPFVRKGERWWTVNWQEGGTLAHKEDEIQ
jgi:hypothetical protein